MYFFQAKKIIGIKRNQFEIFSKKYNLAKDNDSMYFENDVIKNSDSKTFVILNNFFWKDKYNVYYFSIDFAPIIIPEADAKTFRIINKFESEDKFRKYNINEVSKRFDSGSCPK